MKSYVCLFLFWFLLSCSSNSEDLIDIENPTTILTGTGVFVYTNYAPLSNKPVKIYYHIPSSTNQNTPIVFVFHGNGRNADEYRNAMIAKANEYQFIVIAPEFSNTHFSGGDTYNLGNVFVDGDNPSSNSLNPESEWTFSIIEPIFDFMKLRTANENNHYDIIGHSAGAQFAHRFVQFKPNARFNKVVASASGWYTVPDVTIDFPYGFKKSPLESLNLNSLFSKQLFIQVGSLDNDPNASALRRNEFADAQGTNRFDRAHHFFNTAQTVSNPATFQWQLYVHQGLDHTFGPAIIKAADLLFE